MLRDKFKLKGIRSVLGVFKGTPNTKDIEIVDLDNMDSPVKMQDWLLTILLVSIPIIGWIPAVYMIFSKKSSVSKANFCKAYIVYQLIILVITIMLLYIGVNVVATVAEHFLKAQFGITL